MTVHSLHFVCLLVAFILLLLDAFGVVTNRVRLQSLGLALWALSMLLL